MKSQLLSTAIKFLFAFRKRKDTFCIESTGIPYSEIAKIYATMDITTIEKERRLQQAKELFDDITEFFESENKRKYLTTVISRENVEKILLEVEECFIESEDFEKCAKIRSWRTQLK